MPPPAPINADLGLNLALAVVASSHAPVLLLDGDGAIIAASEAFCGAFGINSATVRGRTLASLGDGEWAIPQLISLLKATAADVADVRNYEFDLKREGRGDRRLVLNAHKLDYGAGGETRLLLAIADVTDARIAEKMNEDLIRDKALLLRELQHRVANSLQIIASVLLQSAKKVASEEVRGHLQDAHLRVMSVAAIQKQLAVSAVDRVSLQPYLTQLCESIGASMIHDHKLITLDVNSDETRVSANMSVSLGLIVTELVINALKHAFPRGREGKIVVDYAGAKTGWTLSVSDNGVGMPHPKLAEAGLGTNIVQALAKQLDADIIVSDANPGTRVSIAHIKPAGAPAPVASAV